MPTWSAMARAVVGLSPVSITDRRRARAVRVRLGAVARARCRPRRARTAARAARRAPPRSCRSASRLLSTSSTSGDRFRAPRPGGGCRRSTGWPSTDTGSPGRQGCRSVTSSRVGASAPCHAVTGGGDRVLGMVVEAGGQRSRSSARRRSAQRDTSVSTGRPWVSVPVLSSATALISGRFPDARRP
jgi:hypothetical protein